MSEAPTAGTSRRRGRLDVLVPQSQRRDLEAMTDRLDLAHGDAAAKRSGFWVMLTLSGIIAVSGVVTDSTATVIGAMIIAPLSTPILGIGLGVVTGARAPVVRAVGYVLGGMTVVVLLGVLVTLVLPATTGVLDNSQVTGRTSPGLADLVAAIATGLAGAVALARRDLGDVLPGIAIAISLVPPLAVVGVCLGEGRVTLATGALLLFLSNAVALVVAATVVFSATGYGTEARAARQDAGAPRHRRAMLVATVAVLAVAVPMAANSVQALLADLWLREVSTAADDWVGDLEGATVESVTWQGEDLLVEIRSPGALPDAASLQDQVDDIVPWQPAVVLVHTVGERTSP